MRHCCPLRNTQARTQAIPLRRGDLLLTLLSAISMQVGVDLALRFKAQLWKWYGRHAKKLWGPSSSLRAFRQHPDLSLNIFGFRIRLQSEIPIESSCAFGNA